MPTGLLAEYAGFSMPALIGSNMANSNCLKEGATFVVRRCDAASNYDADEIEVAGTYEREKFCINEGQHRNPLEVMRRRLLLAGEATSVD